MPGRRYQPGFSRWRRADTGPGVQPRPWKRQSRSQTGAGRKGGAFPRGRRPGVGSAAALLGAPPVLMLDEPFNGMDPEGIVWMRGFLAALAAEGRAVLVSSHLMSELQEVAGHL